ncbi:MAG TPA: ABC transporter permease subunit [Candidatus Merdivicinus intestinigallinarum]|nr:ABC transporter permease subunit [Candidatus Merdivicinus intestinigallinarum]
MFRRLFGIQEKERDILKEEQMQSPFRTIVRNFVSNKVSMFGTIVFVLIFLTVFIGSAIYPLDVNFQDTTQQNVSPGFNMMSVPKELKSNAQQISVGATFGVGIDQNGKLYQWGKLSDKLKKMPDTNAKYTQVSAGFNHALALTEDGNVVTWGYDRLGLNNIPFEVKDATDVKQILAGYQMSFVVTEGGELYYWGNPNAMSITIPDEVQGNIEKVVANLSTAFALTKDGQVVMLSNSTTPFANIPEEIQGQVMDVAANDRAAAAVTADGQVHVWGTNDYNLFEVPEAVQGSVSAIAGGRFHFSVLTNEGTVYSWGNDMYNQSSAPELTGITQLDSGYFQNYAIDAGGNVTGWGLKGYLFGTDQYGRDVALRMLAGGRMTMTIGAIAVIISTIIGVIIGGISGYYGGWIDNILMRLTEIVMSIPFLPLAIVLSSIVGNKLSEVGRISMIMVILGFLSWPGLARLIRAQVLSAREQEYVTAAKAMGIREFTLIFRHILPNVITVVIVNTTLSFATCLLTESSLSFIGFGVVEPSPTWGNMLNSAQSSDVIANMWWRWVFPSIALSLAVVSINLIGDGMRDAIDPKSNER